MNKHNLGKMDRIEGIWGEIILTIVISFVNGAMLVDCLSAAAQL